ncbi:MBL fold metallo-hydrolase [Altericroceibacterium endophyticum]|uniref:MBL fold metallo-hydrolase n=1 Tax=Altericroceibacterium endophyticum TaxID=1808508 RepID=A0A6I4T8F3_9SPHN|nr:MBL fold metallo-hydrolase [Altericroceibacterium endophyticum]MXO66401.1 MBL fold metallo-hydrolase [Altericroceibacterium endophyticum]
MTNWPFTQGVHDIGNGLYGYVQPDGTWGWSNAGLVTSRGQTLLVDTLMSVPLTRTMLEDFSRVAGGDHVDQVVNTHANPDHFFGNGVVGDAEIISTATTREEMSEFDPRALAGLADNYDKMGEAGEFLFETMGRKFDFSGVDELTLPNRTFDKSLKIEVGDKTVELTDLGPAHTLSDTIAFVPEDKVVFTGDLLFNEGHPIIWAGPTSNWIAACEFIEALEPDVVVPGHGPICDVSAVRNMRSYFEHLRDEARGRFEAGMDWRQAARDIPMKEYAHWTDPERVVANVYSLYHQWDPNMEAAPPPTLFAEMNRYRHEHGAGGCGHDHGA